MLLGWFDVCVVGQVWEMESCVRVSVGMRSRGLVWGGVIVCGVCVLRGWDCCLVSCWNRRVSVMQYSVVIMYRFVFEERMLIMFVFVVVFGFEVVVVGLDILVVRYSVVCMLVVLCEVDQVLMMRRSVRLMVVIIWVIISCLFCVCGICFGDVGSIFCVVQ